MNGVENEFMLSDDESSASDEESDEVSGSDDGSGDEDIEECEDNGNVQAKLTSSDDNEQERCPVCLNRFIGQDLGTPESCEHTFCYDCIEEWSKNINTCPVDRNEFNYIYLRAVLGGSILQKIKVQPLPKEAEETLVESVTLCEVCHNGAREDRLLLCDGCDLAYHCECLDPPLFYIPIEEWFCPPCSGVFQNGAVAGPSHTRTRRIIPRTRASEAVRSRVQNLRTTGSSAPRSTSSWQRKTNTTQSPKKRKRRCYRKRTFKKVVTLARTKKDLNNSQKGKLATRSSAVIVTYRRRKRRRRTRRKVSKRSAASSKVLPIPSAKQRIAQRLGISKPLQGSTVPQVKQSTKSLSVTSRSEKLPTHSLFGDKHQLMDFSENFAEDPRNVPSASTSVSSGRCSSGLFSSSSSINLLDSIMAGQKILHTKSDGIVIKTDGSLVLKEKSNTKNITSNQKVQEKISSHTPMSVALAKNGVKCITSSSTKVSNSSFNKHAEASKTKDIPERKHSRLSLGKNNSVIKSSGSQHVSRNISTNPTMIEDFSSRVVRHGFKDKFGKKSSLNVALKQQFTNGRISASKINKFNSLSNALSDSETDIPNDTRKPNLKGIVKKEKQNRDEELDNCSSTTSKFLTNKPEKCSNSGNDQSSSNMSNAMSTKFCIKEEILSDNETDCDIPTTITNTMQIKEEVLSDESTNPDCWTLRNENQLLKTANIITKIKKDPSDPEANTLKNSDNLNAQNATTYLSENKLNENKISESKSSDDNKCKNKKRFIKIKEEILSDTEECSQSLLSGTDTQNSMLCARSSESYANNHSNSHTEIKIKKEKEDRYGNSERGFTSNLGNVSKILANELSQKEFLRSTKISNHNLSENNLHFIQAKSVHTVTIDSENDDLPCTQAVLASTVTDLEDLPCTQAVSSPTITEPDVDFPCTQAIHAPYISDDDDLPCTQAAFLSTKVKIASDFNKDSDDDLPCTQATFLSTKKNNFIKDMDDDLPCTQAAPAHFDTDSDDDLPCTQAVFLPTQISNASSKELNLPKTHESGILSDNQALCADSESFNLPATQISNTLRNQSDVLCDDKLINSNKACLDDEPKNNDCNTNFEDILSNIKQLVNSLSVKNTDQIQIRGDEEAIDRKLSDPCENNISEQSNIAVNSKGISKSFKDALVTSNNSKENTENLHSSDLSDNEELSHEKLIEIARKSKVIIPKKIGIHKHLPQVVTTVPVKGHIKIKPSNKRTFSFEEVAKLEAPAVEKTSNSSSVKVIANKLLENSAISFEDSLPPTQRLDSAVIETKPEKFKVKSIISKHSQYAKLNEILDSKTCNLNRTLNVSSVEDSEDLPATQVATQLYKSAKSVQFSKLNNAASRNVKNEIFVPNSEDSILPVTQIQQFSNKNNLSYVPESVKPHSNAVNHKTGFLRNKSSKHGNSLTSTLKSSTPILKSDIVDGINESLNNVNYLEDDLPATQVNNNVPVSKLSNIFEHSNHISKAAVRKSRANNFPEKQMFENKDVTSTMISKSSYKMKQHEESDIFKKPASKRKCSSDDTFNQKKKQHNQNVSVLQSKELQNAQRDHKSSKQSLKYEKPDEDFQTIKSRRNIPSQILKQESKEFNKQNLEQLNSKQKIKKDIEKSDCNTKFSKNLISDKVNITNDKVNDKKQRIDVNHPVTVKQENFDFVKPSSVFNSRKAVSLNGLDLVKIKSEDNSEDDLLPATQIVNNNSYEDDLPATQVINFNDANSNSDEKKNLRISRDRHFLCPTNIKKEVCFDGDDDEISIIEVVGCNSKLPKEIISLDDENTLSGVSAKCDTPSVKNKESVENALVPSRSISKKKTTSIPNNESEKEVKHGLSVKEHKQKCKNDSEDSLKHFKKFKGSKDLSIGKEEKQNDKLPKSTLASKSTKDSTNSSIGKSKKKQVDNLFEPKNVSLTEKPVSKIVNNEPLSGALLKEHKLKDPCNKERSRKEKENCRSLNDNTKNKEVINLKSKPRKRPHENLTMKDGLKKVKYDHSLDPGFCSNKDIPNSNPLPSFQEKIVEKDELKKVKSDHFLDPESCSSEDISVHSFQSNSLNFVDASTNVNYESGVISDSVSTPRSDKGLENVNVLNTSTVKIPLKSLPTEEVKKVIKEDLKEEIANEVKAVLKPFFKTGLISKDDYKDIMRRAVPKIFMNCHNCINPEKIRKLVLSYVLLISKS